MQIKKIKKNIKSMFLILSFSLGSFVISCKKPGNSNMQETTQIKKTLHYKTTIYFEHSNPQIKYEGFPLWEHSERQDLWPQVEFTSNKIYTLENILMSFYLKSHPTAIIKERILYYINSGGVEKLYFPRLVLWGKFFYSTIPELDLYLKKETPTKKSRIFNLKLNSNWDWINNILEEIIGSARYFVNKKKSSLLKEDISEKTTISSAESFLI